MSFITRRTILLAVATSLPVFAALLGARQVEASATFDRAPLGYIGPGAGLGAIGALLAVLGATVLCVAGLVLYPLQLLRNRLSRRDDNSVEGPSEAKPSP